jgi:hemerythrin superfamily protein
MDVTHLLEQDHRKVDGLFADYDERQDADTLEQICSELEVHTTIEEEIVYPRLAELDQELARHAEEEHAEAKDLIAQIRAGDPDTPILAQQLQKAIQQHVHEEESQTFPLLRERLGGQLEQMGDQAQERKEQLTGV